MRTIILTVAAAVLMSGGSAYAQNGPLNADDFITEAQGGATIAAPREISVKNDVVTAATMQDAANRATELTVEESGNFKEDAPAFKLITSKYGGVGAVASGRASYATGAKNKDAIRIAQRHAYVKAFMEAKKNLAQGFNGLSSEGKTILNASLTTMIGNDETLKNSEETVEEVVRQRIDGFIRGYEIRKVENISEESVICVTISVNGKSLGKLSRPVPAVIEAADLKSGLTQVFEEIRRGLVLPAGGRVIMTDSKDACFVGFGSALIHDDDDPEMRADSMNHARIIAEARAKDSLTGLLNGDAVIWEYGMSEKHRRELKDFEDVFGRDATDDLSPDGIRKLENRKKEALTRTATLETTQSIRRGVLPPGIVPRTFRDQDNVWYYAVVVYNPVITQAASDLAAEMKNATLIQPIRKPQTQPGGTDDSQIKSDVPRPGSEIKMIPTGTFDDE